jgi:DNA-binding response OmpR family regulator
VARDVDVALYAPAALLLPADANALQSVLHNLLDHAVRLDFSTIEVHVCNLRRKIGARRIRNVRGVGYLLPP